MRLILWIVTTRRRTRRSHVKAIHPRTSEYGTRDIPCLGKLDDDVDLACRVESNHFPTLPSRAPHATLIVETETVWPTMSVRVEFRESSPICHFGRSLIIGKVRDSSESVMVAIDGHKGSH